MLIDAGYFMKFDATNKSVGHSALLESRILYPKRKQQCLEFFYRMSRGPGDQLVIWVRRDDGSGTVRKVAKVHTITGQLRPYLPVCTLTYSDILYSISQLSVFFHLDAIYYYIIMPRSKLSCFSIKPLLKQCVNY